jgi:diadenosine tetraphosphate (Ap4A) HIT family hydrolase
VADAADVTDTSEAADAADGFCLICSMEEADPAGRVFLDDLWAAEVAPGFEVPGWFFLRARRHAERLTGLDDAETATLGRRAHDLVSAVERVTGAPAVYLLSFGENYRHFHALIAARGDQVPPEARGWALLGLLELGRDVPAAQAVAGDVMLAYEEIVRGREHAAVG